MLVSVVTAAKRYCSYAESNPWYGGGDVVMVVGGEVLVVLLVRLDDELVTSPTTRPTTKPIITGSVITTANAMIFSRRPSFILAISLSMHLKPKQDAHRQKAAVARLMCSRLPCVRAASFSLFATRPTCDKRMDRQTTRPQHIPHQHVRLVPAQHLRPSGLFTCRPQLSPGFHPELGAQCRLFQTFT